MRGRWKCRRGCLGGQPSHGALLDQALAAWGQLPAGELKVLREYFAETARKVFQAGVAGILVKHGDGYTLGVVSPAGKEESGDASLLSHVESFAAQAVENNKLLNFRFSYRDAGGEKLYCGLAEPLVTSQSSAALLVVRKSVFSSSEVSVFRVLSSLARLSLDNAELASLYSGQQKNVNELLDQSAELGVTARLDAFLSRFVVRAAEFLGFESAFLAVVESGECRLRWGAKEGKPIRADIDVSAASRRALESGEACVAENTDQLQQTESTQLLRWEWKMKQYLGVPLLATDKSPLGVLGLVDKKDRCRVSQEDIRRAGALGTEVAAALEACHNLHLSGQHKKRAEDLMEMSLHMGSALRLPEFVKSLTER